MATIEEEARQLMLKRHAEAWRGDTHADEQPSDSPEAARQRMIDRAIQAWKQPAVVVANGDAGGADPEGARRRMIERSHNAGRQPLGEESPPVRADAVTSRADIGGPPTSKHRPATRENVKERIDLENAASRVLPPSVIFSRMSIREIREAVILAKQPTAKLDGQSDVYVRARFDAVMAPGTRADSGERVARYDINGIHLEEVR